MSKIEWVGEVLSKQGYGILTREFLFPIKEDVKLIAKEDYISPENKYSSGIWLEETVSSYLKSDSPIRVSFSIPNLYAKEKDKFNIGLSLWDSTLYPIEWAQKMNEMDALIFPSEGMAQAYKNTGSKVPIAVFNPFFNTSKWTLSGNTTEIAANKEYVKYLFEGSWDPKSNIPELILTFTSAFERLDDVMLVLKIECSNLEEQGQIKGAIHGLINGLRPINRPKIVIIFDSFSEEKSCELARGCHFYIDTILCSSIPISRIRAACCGLPLVVNTIDNSPKLNCDTLSFASSYAPITGVNYPMYRIDQMWRRPDIGHAITKLRLSYDLVKSNKLQYNELRELTSKEYKQQFSSTNLIEVCENLYESKKVTEVPILGLV